MITTDVNISSINSFFLLFPFFLFTQALASKTCPVSSWILHFWWPVYMYKKKMLLISAWKSLDLIEFQKSASLYENNFKSRRSLNWIFVNLIKKISRNYLRWVWGNLTSKIVVSSSFIYIIFAALTASQWVPDNSPHSQNSSSVNF